jgi:hemerythrin superfamily protein
MDPYKLLKTDQQTVSELFERIESARGLAKFAAFKKLKTELDVHAHIEETIFYPALKKAEESRDITLEAYEEHKVVKTLLAELASGKPNDEWNAKLTVLKENVDHHVDEEEGELFDKAKDVLTDEQAELLGDEMAAEKKRKGLPVAEELGKPSLLKRAVSAVFGSTNAKRGAKKQAGKRKTVKSAARKTAATKTAKRARKSSRGPTAKKSAARKKSSRK